MVFTTRRKKTEDEAQAEAEARQTRELCSALARLPLMGKLNQLKPGQELPEKLLRGILKQGGVLKAERPAWVDRITRSVAAEGTTVVSAGAFLEWVHQSKSKW